MQLVPGDEITVTKDVMKFGKMEFVGYEELLQMDFDKLAGLKPTPQRHQYTCYTDEGCQVY